jgi:tetratricopeptide (TPR) repeat protein
MFSGQFKKGEDLAKRALELLKTQERKENAAQVSINLAANQALVGKCQQAKENLKAGLTEFRGRLSIAGAALVFAGCGDQGQAQTLLDEALRLYPKDTPVAVMMAPLVRGQIEQSRGNSAAAVQLFESVRTYDLGLMVGLANSYLRGEAYLQQRRGNEAGAEFQKIIDHRGVDPFSPAHALAYLGLARSATVSGDTAKSRKSYQDFFALWKDADQDLPVLIQAKKEYEQLK